MQSPPKTLTSEAWFGFVHSSVVLHVASTSLVHDWMARSQTLVHIEALWNFRCFRFLLPKIVFACAFITNNFIMQSHGLAIAIAEVRNQCHVAHVLEPKYHRTKTKKNCDHTEIKKNAIRISKNTNTKQKCQHKLRTRHTRATLQAKTHVHIQNVAKHTRKKH